VLLLFAPFENSKWPPAEVSQSILHQFHNLQLGIILLHLRNPDLKTKTKQLTILSHKINLDCHSLIYVPMNVFNMCCYCLHHLKIQNGHQRRSKFTLKPYGKQHFHLLLENSRTEFNQTWQRCFLWGIDQSEFSKSHGGHVFWRICTKVTTLV
jgi:hypothetical protein